MNFFRSLFSGCLHQHTTFPQTPSRKGFKGKTYVCCVDCGREFLYDWATFRVGAEIKQPAFRANESRELRGSEIGPVKRVER